MVCDGEPVARHVPGADHSQGGCQQGSEATDGSVSMSDQCFTRSVAKPRVRRRIGQYLEDERTGLFIAQALQFHATRDQIVCIRTGGLSRYIPEGRAPDEDDWRHLLREYV